MHKRRAVTGCYVWACLGKSACSEAATKLLRIVSWESIQADRFSLTPQGLFDCLVRNAQHTISSWGGDQQRRQARMGSVLEQDAEARQDAERNIASDATSPRPLDKFGLAPGSDHFLCVPKFVEGATQRTCP